MSVTARENPDVALATCLISDGVGAMVKTVGPVVNGRHQVETCDPSDFSKMPASAMLIHKIDDTTGLVQFRGSIKSVYSGLTPGELLFVDDGGGLSDIPPEPTVGSPSKFMQSVGVAVSDDIIELRPNYVMAKRRY